MVEKQLQKSYYDSTIFESTMEEKQTLEERICIVMRSSNSCFSSIVDSKMVEIELQKSYYAFWNCFSTIFELTTLSVTSCGSWAVRAFHVRIKCIYMTLCLKCGCVYSIACAGSRITETGEIIYCK